MRTEISSQVNCQCTRIIETACFGILQLHLSLSYQVGVWKNCSTIDKLAVKNYVVVVHIGLTFLIRPCAY
jgi:hypothetical protein